VLASQLSREATPVTIDRHSRAPLTDTGGTLDYLARRQLRESGLV
jgi:hypothetical protein